MDIEEEVVNNDGKATRIIFNKELDAIIELLKFAKKKHSQDVILNLCNMSKEKLTQLILKINE